MGVGMEADFLSQTKREISLPLNQQKMADVLSSSQKILEQTQLSLGRGRSNLLKGCYPLKNVLLSHSYFHPVAEL